MKNIFRKTVENSGKSLKRILFLGLCTVLLILVFFTIALFWNRARYEPLSSSYGSFSNRVDDTLKIGIIGDSWAAGKKLDVVLSDALLACNVHGEVVSYGHPGGKSRDILRDLCETEEAKVILHDKDIDVFVIMVGVNDSKGHDGPTFYSYHMEHLLKLIASHGALAVIVDIPRYGIEADKAPTIAHWSKREASRILFDSPKSGRDNRPAYRSILANMTSDKPRVIVVDEMELPSYETQPELWGDPVHLNAAGYAYAAQPIADAIAKIYTAQSEKK